MKTYPNLGFLYLLWYRRFWLNSYYLSNILFFCLTGTVEMLKALNRMILGPLLRSQGLEWNQLSSFIIRIWCLKQIIQNHLLFDVESPWTKSQEPFDCFLAIQANIGTTLNLTCLSVEILLAFNMKQNIHSIFVVLSCPSLCRTFASLATTQ